MATGNQSLNICGTEIIDSRCIVEFRPDDNWEGEYGFDWFRIGDCKEPIRSGLTDNKILNTAKDGSSHYVTHNIIGKYIAKDSFGHWQYQIDGTSPDPDYPSLNVRSAFATDTETKSYYWADKLVTNEYKFFCIKGSNRNYIIPWITLFYSSVSNNTNNGNTLPKEMTIKDIRGIYRRNPIYKTKATVKLIISARNIKRIEFEPTRHISVSPKTIDGISNGKDTQHKLTINYNYKFDEDHQSIKAYAIHNDGVTRTFAGQINIERCSPKTVDICFVNVKTKRGEVCSDGVLAGFEAIAQVDNLRKYLAQAHIIPNIIYKEQVISLDDQSKSYHNNTHTSRIRGDVFLALGKAEQGTVRNLKGELRYKELGDKLEELFNAKEENRNEINMYKIFFLDRPIYSDRDASEDSTKGGLAGCANDIVSKSAIIAKVPKNSSTVCHELLHCFGLYHSFSNEGDYTYKKCMTSNIMDYGFMGEKDNCLERISLSRWQWRKIRQNATKEVTIRNNLVRVS